MARRKWEWLVGEWVLESREWEKVKGSRIGKGMIGRSLVAG